MKKLIISFTALFIFTSAFASEEVIQEANFKEINSFQQIQQVVDNLLQNKISKKILIILSLEKVILQPASKAFKIDDQNYFPLAKKALSKIKPGQRIFMNETLLVDYENKLVDKSAPDFFNDVFLNQLPIIIITSNLPGSYNKINHLELWSIELLKSKGIDLSKGTFFNTKMILSSMTKIFGTYPTFYRGLLSCATDKNDNTYHQVFATFLANSNFIPEIVVMVHFDARILNTTAEQLKSLNKDTKFIGLLYDNKSVNLSDEIDYAKYLDFMTEYVNKVNNVKRNDNSELIKNPYEKELE